MSQQYESAPQAPPGPPPGGPSGPRANFGQRLGQYLIDAILISVVIVILYQISTVLYLIGALGAIAYWIVLTGNERGQTVGMMALNIRVVDGATGGPIGYGRAFLRLLIMWLGSIPIYLGWFWMLWDSQKQTWHDKVSNSFVVPADAYPRG
ncbi:MAG TPA: RDD family protein [Solirubrobacter sp.]|jgi:uncharacterized RDD family membrane protein YckC|nr:RDD family protein [Solirubrobacter sp.]